MSSIHLCDTMYMWLKHGDPVGIKKYSTLTVSLVVPHRNTEYYLGIFDKGEKWKREMRMVFQ